MRIVNHSKKLNKYTEYIYTKPFKSFFADIIDA